ncbi:hypothetical protein TK90_2658 (plasmid) [Thioalkalivibrio sp. K90mix]|nr:hypothetical protein TK90_2658 [Thioalkalivibrio sp. K90mix]
MNRPRARFFGGRLRSFSKPSVNRNRAAIALQLSLVALMGASHSLSAENAGHRVVISAASQQVASSSNPSLPSGCDEPGDTCDDGSFFAGTHSDGRAIYVASTMTFGAWGTEGVISSFPRLPSVANGDGELRHKIMGMSWRTQKTPVHFCEDMDEHGHTDWFLPSSSEIDSFEISAAEFRELMDTVTHMRAWISEPMETTYGRIWSTANNGEVDSHRKGSNARTFCVRHAEPYGAHDDRLDPENASVGDRGVFRGLEKYRELMYAGSVDGRRIFYAARGGPVLHYHLSRSGASFPSTSNTSAIPGIHITGNECRLKFGGGWHHPNLPELQLLWENRDQLPVDFGASSVSHYWSTTEVPGGHRFDGEDALYALDLEDGSVLESRIDPPNDWGERHRIRCAFSPDR